VWVGTAPEARPDSDSASARSKERAIRIGSGKHRGRSPVFPQPPPRSRERPWAFRGATPRPGHQHCGPWPLSSFSARVWRPAGPSHHRGLASVCWPIRIAQPLSRRCSPLGVALPTIRLQDRNWTTPMDTTACRGGNTKTGPPATRLPPQIRLDRLGRAVIFTRLRFNGVGGGHSPDGSVLVVHSPVFGGPTSPVKGRVAWAPELDPPRGLQRSWSAGHRTCGSGTEACLPHRPWQPLECGPFLGGGLK